MTNNKTSWAISLPSLQGSKELVLKYVEPGAFWMGCRPDHPDFDDPNLTYFECRISAGYWLGITPVTVGQFLAFDVDASAEVNSLDSDPIVPAHNLNWVEADAWCRALHRWLDREMPGGYVAALPTEAQWEFACRAGRNACEVPVDHESDAWFAANSEGRLHPVALKKPNAWGFLDMLGNVGEWCVDHSGGYPTGSSAVDWVGNDRLAKLRSRRGGGYGASKVFCENRAWNREQTRAAHFGFRVCIRVPCVADWTEDGR